MKCFVEVITTPTVDTPGALLLLHFDDHRYLVGNVSEGTQRACIEHGISLRKVSTVLLTGRTQWSQIGGLLGLTLELADVKKDAQAAISEAIQASAQAGNVSAQHKQARLQQTSPKLDIYGTINLNHMIATSRRFIFRTGMPMNVVEYGAQEDVERRQSTISKPTWQDERIRVWTMAISPEVAAQSPLVSTNGRKRTYEEVEPHYTTPVTRSEESNHASEMRKAIVAQMFNSGWKLDRLLPQPLSEVRMPARLFVRDNTTKQYIPYSGAPPGSEGADPNQVVWVREPWPGALTEQLPLTKPALESLSYIIRNHPQRGKFQPEKAIKSNVPKGPLWAKLTSGHTVRNDKGEEVTPDMVLGPGKQGGGLAVIDLPTVEYITPLVARPEWSDVEVMDGVDAIFWIVGPGVALDERLRKFQAEKAHIKHIVASSDYCPNTIMLEAAATNALRHHYIDNTVFPQLQYSSVHNDTTDENIREPPVGVVAAQRGQIITLEPQVDLQTSNVKPPLQLASLQARITQEFLSLGMSEQSVAAVAQELDTEAWTSVMPYGDAEIIILGTGSSRPAKCRNVSGTLVRVPGCGSYLLDCGEGTLGTLRRMFSFEKLEVILRDLRMIWVSHLHADHHLGLASIIKAWSQATASVEHTHTLGVVSDAPMLHWLHEYGSAEDLGLQRILPLATTLSRNVESLSMEQGTKLRLVPPIPADNTAETGPDNTLDYLDVMNLQTLNTVYVTHCRGAQAISFTTKTGLKISYSGDCRPSGNFAAIGQESHVLIHEATFQDDMRSEALAKKHSTAGEALIVGNKMKAKLCLLTHFSQRYPEMPTLGAQVRGRGSSPPLEGLDDVLEDPDDDQPSASMDVEGGSATNGNDDNENGSSGAAKLDLRPAVRRSTGYLELVDEQDIKNLLATTGMKVIFGFDYMRLKLSDVPRLEAKQPLLRKMYDEGIGKDAFLDNHDNDDQLVPVSTKSNKKEDKKRSKAEKLEHQRVENEKRAKRSEDKWAESSRKIAERQTS